MKLLAIILMIFLPVVSMAKNSPAERIERACIVSVEKREKRVSNYLKVCRCIGEKHVEYSQSEEDRADGQDRLQWVIKFYESTDQRQLQKMSDESPRFSSFDDQVVADCMQ